MPQRDSRTVYSTDPNFKLCPRCGNYPCRCRKLKSLPPQDQTALILREHKGRGGKTVTIVRGLILSPDDLKALAKQLKQACGTGGTVKEETIEIQGDHRVKVVETLRLIGYKTKMVGG